MRWTRPFRLIRPKSFLLFAAMLVGRDDLNRQSHLRQRLLDQCDKVGRDDATQDSQPCQFSEERGVDGPDPVRRPGACLA